MITPVSIGYALYAAGPRFFELHRYDFGDLQGYAVDVWSERGRRIPGMFVHDYDGSPEYVAVRWQECTGEALSLTTPGSPLSDTEVA